MGEYLTDVNDQWLLKHKINNILKIKTATLTKIKTKNGCVLQKILKIKR